MPHSKKNAEVCDATGFYCSNAARLIKCIAVKIAFSSQ